MAIGDTVLPGTEVVDNSKIWRVPLILNHHYVLDYIQDQRYLDLTESLLTGNIRTPIVHLTNENICRKGTSCGYEGPGMLSTNEDKLIVEEPGNFIWAYKTPYIYGYKVEDKLEIKENNETLQKLSFDNIRNDTIPNHFVSEEQVKEWFERAAEGDEIILDYYLSNFNDGRNPVLPSHIVAYFGESVQEYMHNYTSNAPVMAYKNDYTAVEIGSSASTLGSYPEYGDAARAANAREFARRWNGTIVPPDNYASGKETGGFISVRDPKAPGGYASHGTCPPARALRNAVSAAGCPLPVGMTWAFHTVSYGYNPATDVKVFNTNEYPIKIIMSSSGAGAGTTTYAQIFHLVPN